MCLGTNVSGHNRVWAQSYLGTIVSGHNRVLAQSCLGTIVSGHSRVGPIMYGHKHGGTLRLCSEKRRKKIQDEKGFYQGYAQLEYFLYF